MAQSVQEILYNLNTKRVREMRAEIRERFKATDDDRRAQLDSKEDERFGFRAQIAGRLHLLDLKRAGHSPTRTEYRISGDGLRPLGPVTRPAFLSIYGSPAQSCAEMASP